MRAEVAGVVARAVDQRGIRRRRNCIPIEIQARRINQAAVVPDQALAVQHRHVEPRIVRMVAGGPDDGPDFGR